MIIALLSATFDKAQIGRALDDEVRALSRRMRTATEKAGREMLLDPLRQATRDALNSRKLPTTWRAAVYPKDDAITLSPAFFVYSKAPKSSPPLRKARPSARLAAGATSGFRPRMSHARRAAGA